MPDVWATVAELDSTTQERLADVLETRGADPKQQDTRRAFAADIDFPAAANVLEVGCGTGVLTRALAAGIPNVMFEQADARSLAFTDERFDAAVFDSTLSHVPEPERALAEAFRVLCPNGMLAAFDGDYATTTVALDEHVPLQVCVNAMMANSVTDRRVMGRLPTLLRECGFRLEQTRSHGFVETGDGGYRGDLGPRAGDRRLALDVDGHGSAFGRQPRTPKAYGRGVQNSPRCAHLVKVSRRASRKYVQPRSWSSTTAGGRP